MNKTEKKDIANIINDNMAMYSEYTIRNRALPMLEDGLKPVYRRILWTMNEMKATRFVKSQNIEGQVMKFHPHGSTYPTMVGMAQEDNHLTPLIEGKGNFAQHTSRDLQPGAARYTEAKLSPLAIDIFKDLNRNVVDFIPNYDGTAEIPSILPVKFPMILHMGQEGIAVGMANKMPSFNINDICEATQKYIETREKVLLIPDFATGGKIIKDEAAFKKLNEEGKASIRIRAKAEIIGNTISITEIPYSTTREAIIEKIIKLEKDKQITEVTGIKDLTGLNGMEIEITCKRNTNMEILLEKLYKLTPLEDSYSCNMNVLHEGLPKVMGTWEIIDKWVKWRVECIEKQLKGEYKKLNMEKHLLMSYGIIIDDIDEVISIIRNSKENEVINKLTDRFIMSSRQAEHIANMKLRNLNREYMAKKIEEIQQLTDKIKEIEFVMYDMESKLKIVIKDLEEVKNKYGSERRSEVIEVNKITAKSIEKAIEKQINNYNVTLFVTKDGYVKKVQKAIGTHKLKLNDEVIHEFKTSNTAELVVFVGTDAYKIPVSSLTDCKMSDFGDYLPSLLDEKEFIGFTVVDNKYKFILICYDNGKIAKVDLKSFRTTTQRKKLSNSLYSGAKVLSIQSFEDDEDITIMQFINKKDREIVVNTKEIMTKAARNTQGVVVARNTKYIVNK